MNETLFTDIIQKLIVSENSTKHTFYALVLMTVLLTIKFILDRLIFKRHGTRT